MHCGPNLGHDICRIQSNAEVLVPGFAIRRRAGLIAGSHNNPHNLFPVDHGSCPDLPREIQNLYMGFTGCKYELSGTKKRHLLRETATIMATRNCRDFPSSILLKRFLIPIPKHVGWTIGSRLWYEASIGDILL